MLGAIAINVTFFVFAIQDENVTMILTHVLLMPLIIFLMVWLFVVNPNQARVLLLFGRYVAQPPTRGCAGPTRY